MQAGPCRSLNPKPKRNPNPYRVPGLRFVLVSFLPSEPVAGNAIFVEQEQGGQPRKLRAPS